MGGSLVLSNQPSHTHYPQLNSFIESSFTHSFIHTSRWYNWKWKFLRFTGNLSNLGLNNFHNFRHELCVYGYRIQTQPTIIIIPPYHIVVDQIGVVAWHQKELFVDYAYILGSTRSSEWILQFLWYHIPHVV